MLAKAVGQGPFQEGAASEEFVYHVPEAPVGEMPPIHPIHPIHHPLNTRRSALELSDLTV